MSQPQHSSIDPAEMIVLAEFWRQRYTIKTSTPVIRHVLTAQDTKRIKPILSMSSSDLENEVIKFLLKEKQLFFEEVHHQLYHLLQVWNIVMKIKDEFDSGKGALPKNQKILEALLLCGQTLPLRSNIAPRFRESAIITGKLRAEALSSISKQH